jgi:aerobic-type carbon monoxide dehydrogenase small subunit (CoxS/CutS family)
MSPDLISATFTINGQSKTIESPPDRTLLEVLREDLQLTGTQYACGEGACGACTVLIDGKPAFSCSTQFSDVAGKTVTTIEGLGRGDQLHPVQAAFLAESAFQCGACTSGMIMASVALLERKPHPTDAEIVEALDGHVCRCCIYPKIIAAARSAVGIVPSPSGRGLG